MSPILLKCLLASLLVTWFLCACSGPRPRVYDSSDGRKARVGQKPYVVNGERYEPLPSHKGFVQDGLASWYGADFHGKPTSNGETYDMYAMTAAHKTLPLGVNVLARNKRNGKEVVIRINDRGPFVKDRIIDLSYTAAQQLGFSDAGIVPVHIEALGYGDGPGDYRSPSSYDSGNYAIQVAAFANGDNAQRLVSEMKKQHGTAGIQDTVVNGSRFFRVRVGRYGSLQRAEAARKDFERNGYAGSFVVALD